MTGGRSARVTLGDLEGQLDGLRSAEDSLLPDESQFFHGARHPRPRRAPRAAPRRPAHPLPAPLLRAHLGPRAIERFRRFVVNHSSELALPNLLLA